MGDKSPEGITKTFVTFSKPKLRIEVYPLKASHNKLVGSNHQLFSNRMHLCVLRHPVPSGKGFWEEAKRNIIQLFGQAVHLRKPFTATVINGMVKISDR